VTERDRLAEEYAKSKWAYLETERYYCATDFKAGWDAREPEVAALRKRLEEAVEVIEFYSKGGNFQTDIWQHPNLGYFTGKRAREFLKEGK
jgi:hypothetical protein